MDKSVLGVAVFARKTCLWLSQSAGLLFTFDHAQPLFNEIGYHLGRTFEEIAVNFDLS